MMKIIMLTALLTAHLSMELSAVRVAALQDCLENINKKPAGANKKADLGKHVLKNASKMVYFSTPQVSKVPAPQMGQKTLKKIIIGNE
ncbi:MAG TPA: hypothetical protein VHO47_03885 [Candidatus Babeliales bacterium]|nr:hypothetical protein [Candidatus Babeliales bacterium]